MKIAIASYHDTGRYLSVVPNEDEMLLELFRSHNHDVELKVWDDESVDWTTYDIIIIKSTWDYFIEKIDTFYAWLDYIKTTNIPCLNHPDLIKWNADKHYLLDIEAAGLAIVPSIIIEKNGTFNSEFSFAKFNTDELIVKPTISGGAMNTLRLNKNNVDEHVDEINTWLKDQAYLVQPLKQEIITEGEWSFLYFNGTYSHHLLKVAKEGEFRIQHFFGGKIVTTNVDEKLIEISQKYIDQFAKDSLYARVDGVWSNGIFELMELELIEPYMFFFTNENSLSNYYTAFEQLSKKIIHEKN
jgi:glutathione synthase/RimK-type ligase-like ATP-grasp enzyme